MLDNSGYFRLTDFGFSLDLEEEHKENKEIVGTLEYIAPEVINSVKYDYSADIYSLGIICYEIIFGYRPYFANGRSELKEMISQKKIEVSAEQIPKQYINNRKEIASFLSGLLKYNSSERMNISDMKKHCWFKGFNWNMMNNKTMKSPFIDLMEIKKCKEERNSGINEEIYNDELVGCETMERYKELIINSDKHKDYFTQYNYDGRKQLKEVFSLKNINSTVKLNLNLIKKQKRNISEEINYEKHKTLTTAKENIKLKHIPKSIDLLQFFPNQIITRNKIQMKTNSTYSQYKSEHDALVRLNNKQTKQLSKSTLAKETKHPQTFKTNSTVSLPKILCKKQISVSGKNIFTNENNTNIKLKQVTDCFNKKTFNKKDTISTSDSVSNIFYQKENKKYHIKHRNILNTFRLPLAKRNNK